VATSEIYRRTFRRPDHCSNH